MPLKAVVKLSRGFLQYVVWNFSPLLANITNHHLLAIYCRVLSSTERRREKNNVEEEGGRGNANVDFLWVEVKSALSPRRRRLRRRLLSAGGSEKLERRYRKKKKRKRRKNQVRRRNNGVEALCFFSGIILPTHPASIENRFLLYSSLFFPFPFRLQAVVINKANLHCPIDFALCGMKSSLKFFWLR